MLTRYFKVLGEGFKTKNGFDWKPALSGDWIEEKDFDITPNEPCGKGIHVWKDFPRYTVLPYIIDHTFEVEVKGDCLGQDKDKARFRAIRLINVLSRSEIFFPKADLRSADLCLADLRSADLSSADLSSADLSLADLSLADLSLADLSLADLSLADLRSADLSLADLSLADLSLADLRSADLSLADLSSANLSSAVIDKTKLSEIQMKQAIF